MPESISFLVIDVARLIRQKFETELAAANLGVTAGEARTLLYAGRSPGLRQAVLAERINVEPMTLVGFLDRLEAAGLIARLPDPSDRRAKRILPTDAARPLIEKIEAIALMVRETAIGDFSEREEEAVRTGLLRMRSALATERKAVPA